MQKHEGWKSMCAIIYLLICLFDFVLVPVWFGASRAFIETEQQLFKPEEFANLDPSVQIKIIDASSFQHDPFTLKGGGLFHMAFGALLTGSALSRKKDNDSDNT